MRRRTDPYRVDLSELAIVSAFRFEKEFWRFREVLEDVERAFRQDPLSYNKVRANACPGRDLFVAVTAAFPGCPKLRWLIEIDGEVVRVWAISAPSEPLLNAEIIALFDKQESK